MALPSSTRIFLTNFLRVRPISSCILSKRDLHVSPAQQSNHDDDKKGWFKGKLSGLGFSTPKIETGHSPASNLLSDRHNIFELQIHEVIPCEMQNYLKEYEQFVDKMHQKNTGAELAGSWTVNIGDQDTAVHIWKYKGGYRGFNTAVETYRTDTEFNEFRRKRNSMLRSRSNQILLSFSFWPFTPPTRNEKNIYELRSYVLKPGTMIEWGNNWARGLQFRKEMEDPVGGFFSNMGDLYNVHHMWAYKDLEARKELRETAWQRPGWDDVVSYTVPLIRTLKSRILIPVPFSPLQ